MSTDAFGPAVEVFSTCPASSQADPGTYLRHVIEVARWSERSGCRGMLVYSDNSQLDAWLVSQVILQNTEALCPLVAVQPVYMHPYTLAKMVATFGATLGRRVYLNMVAGGFTKDLLALADTTPHDRRYERLAEYTHIIMALLAGGAPVTHDGEFYKVDKLRLTPSIPPDLLPGVFVSGSSDAGLAAARRIGATAIKYPAPPEEEVPVVGDGLAGGIRVGIIARERASEAWEVAHARFPEDRRGQLTRQLATRVSDSSWHHQLTDMVEPERSPYWLVPFQNYKTMCPYLVGSYEQVGEQLARYFAAGYGTVILDVPPDVDELQHTSAAFSRAAQAVP